MERTNERPTMTYRRGCWEVTTQPERGRWVTTVSRDGVVMSRTVYAIAGEAVEGHARAAKFWAEAWFEFARECGEPAEVAA